MLLVARHPWDSYTRFNHTECACTSCDAVRAHHAMPGALCMHTNTKSVATWPLHGMNVWGPSPDVGTPFIVIGPSIPGTCGHRIDAIVILAYVDGALGPRLTLKTWPTAVDIERCSDR